MPDISLKNTTATARAASSTCKGVQHVLIPVPPRSDIEVDDHTAEWLAEAWENGGDLEVTSGAPVLKAKKVKERNRRDRPGRNEAEAAPSCRRATWLSPTTWRRRPRA